MPSEACFNKCLRIDYKHVKRPKKTRLGKCDTCTKLKKRKKGCAADVMYTVSRLLSTHIKLMASERSTYRRRKSKSLMEPSTYTSIILDNADNLMLPHQCELPKGWIRKARRPKMMIGGLIDHGNRIRKIYVSFNWFGQGPNGPMTTLYHHLRSLREMGRLSPTLLFQADNCSRENKNRWLLAFMAMLIAKGWFSEIHLSFLYPGHTHEDIDQMFSNFSKLEDTWDCDSPPAFFNQWMKKAYVSPPFPSCEWITHNYDWKVFFKLL